MTRVFRLVCGALLLVGAASTVAAAKPTVAILGLEVIDKSGVPSNDDVTFAKTLTEDLRGRAKLGGPYTLANGADKELIDLKLMKGCDDDKDLKCMAGIGGDLNVDFLMYGSVTKKAGTYEITISLLDVKQRHREKTAPTTVPTTTSAGALLKKSQSIYNGLTGQTDSCTITVKTPGVDRATILIGTKEAGNITNGVGQVTGLADGKYTIAVEAKDYHRWTRSDIACTGGETTNLTADLAKLDTKILPDPDKVNPPGGDGTSLENHEITGSVSHHGATNTWKYVAIGGGVVTAAAAITFGLKWNDLAATGKTSTFQYGANCIVPMPPDANHVNGLAKPGSGATQDQCDNAPGNRTWTYVSGVVGLAALGVTSIAIYKAVTANSDLPDEHASLGHRKHHEPFAITPVVSPAGAGATFRMEW